MAQLPNYCPSSRELTVGEYSVKRFVTLGGAVVRRQYGTKPYDYRLVLEYGGEGGIPDRDAAAIYSAWLTGFGATEPVALSDKTWGGADSEIPDAIDDSIIWYFTKTPPVLDWQLPGYSRVRLTLRGRQP